jgi:hypothetical protein
VDSIDVYRKTLASDGIAGLYRGFSVSCVGIIVYREVFTLECTTRSSQRFLLIPFRSVT